jgi:hypothetical protein
MEHRTTRPFCSKDKIRLAASSAFQQLPNFSAIQGNLKDNYWGLMN